MIPFKESSKRNRNSINKYIYILKGNNSIRFCIKIYAWNKLLFSKSHLHDKIIDILTIHKYKTERKQQMVNRVGTYLQNSAKYTAANIVLN